MAQTDTTECDVLVVGSGAGGFAAAITAAHHGLDVILAEKAPVFGGTIALSAGVIWIPCSSHARRAGVEDSIEQAMAYLDNEVGNRLDRDVARTYLEHAPQMLDFFEANTQVRYSLSRAWPDYHPEVPGASPGGRSLWVDHFDGRSLGEQFFNLRPPLETTMILGGMTIARDDVPHFLRMTRSARSALHVARLFARHAIDRLRYSRGTRIANGNALIARLAKTLLDRGLPLWLSCPVRELLNDNATVTGAVVARDGKRVEIKTRRGVVLACGGFPADDALKREHYDHLRSGKNHHSLPPESNSGDGIRIARDAGALFAEDGEHPAAWTPVSLVPQSNGSPEPFPISSTGASRG